MLAMNVTGPSGRRGTKVDASASKTPKSSMLARIYHYVTDATVEAWIKLPEHTRQRDINRRLTYALSHHFQTASPDMAIVKAIEYDGVIYKGDGHTRAEAWKRGLLERPSTLTVIIFRCGNQEDFLELYTHFDSLDAVEKTGDILSGALRQNGITPKSKLILNYKFAAALRVATRCFGTECTDVYLNVDEFAKEIRTLDDRDYSARDLGVGVMAGYFALRRKHGDKIDPFFDKYVSRSGNKSGSEVDGVQLLDIITTTPKSGSGNSLTIPLAEMTIACGELWLADKQAKLYKEPHLRDNDGSVLVVPRVAKVEPVKLAGYLKGKRGANI